MHRVLIVEDDPLMQAFLAESIQNCEALQLVGVAGTVAEAEARLQPPADTVDVLLADLGLPDGSGLQVIRRALQINPQCQALVLSLFGDDDSVLSSIEAGALGYIHKDADPGDIAKTILEMLAGGSPISPMIARRVLSKYRGVSAAAAPLKANHGSDIALLSEREQEVLVLISRGFSYREIAELKALSIHTVQTHIKNMYAKLAVHSKNEAIFEASRMGLI